MSTRQAARQDGAAHRRDPFANVRARVIPGKPTASEGLARLEHERLDPARAHAEDVCDLAMRVVAELEQHQSGSLVVGQPPDVVHHLPQVLAALDLVRQIVEERRIARRRLDLVAGADLG